MQSQELPESGFQAQITCQDTLVCVTGQPVNLKVKVKNISNVSWNNNGLTVSSKYGIFLGHHWKKKNGQILRWDDGRCSFDKELATGQEVELTLMVNPPELPGNYQLQLDLVQEGVAWFSERASNVKNIDVDVKPKQLDNSNKMSSLKSSPAIIVNRLLDYKARGFKNIEGWLSESVFEILEAIIYIHSKLRIFGSIYEIGVHHGRFLLALNSLRNNDESCVAIDIFDNQELNIDCSGKGSFSQLENNIRDYVTSELQNIEIVTIDSTDINHFNVIEMEKRYGRAKLFSIDGGHTVEHTINDLLIAAQLLKNGGLIFLDDYYNPHWPGVHEGFSRYMIFHRAKIAPLLYIGNKLLLTTVSYHKTLYTEFTEYLLGKPHIKNIKYVTMYGYDAIAIG